MERAGDRDGALSALDRRLRRWRESFGGRGRALPAWIWDEATKVAREQGVQAVARRLRLNGVSLERRVEWRSRRSGDDRPAFVEVSPAPDSVPSGRQIQDTGDAGCVVEIGDGGGRRITIRASDARALDWAALSAAVFGAGR
jgi:hypothetical protein